MSDPTPTYTDPIGDKLAELAELGKVYSQFRASGQPAIATRCAMLRLVGETYDLASKSLLDPSIADA